MECSLDCQLINNIVANVKFSARLVERKPSLPTEVRCGYKANRPSSPIQSAPVCFADQSPVCCQKLSDFRDNLADSTSRIRSRKLNLLFPTEKKSNRSKSLDGSRPRNSSIQINSDVSFPPVKEMDSSAELKELNEFRTNKNKAGKSVKFIRNKNSISNEEIRADSCGTDIYQGNTSRFDTLQSVFSTRLAPTPIRTTHFGKTTAGRRLLIDETEIPLHDRSPAGLSTNRSGSVSECMRWDLSQTSRMNLNNQA